MPRNNLFPESLNDHLLSNHDGLVGSTRTSFYAIALRDYARGKRDERTVEEIGEIKRLLQIIRPRNILRVKKNVVGCINGHEIARRVCHIRPQGNYSSRILRGHAYTEDDVEKIVAYGQRHRISLATVSKILKGENVSTQALKNTQKFLNDLHDVFWSMVLAERYRASDDD